MGEKERKILQMLIEGVSADLKRTAEEVSDIRKKMPSITAHVENEQDWKRLMEDKINVISGIVGKLTEWKAEMMFAAGKIFGVGIALSLIAGYFLSKIFGN